jgi:hypothetical protein
MTARHICRRCVWDYKNGLVRDLARLDDLLPSFHRGEWVDVTDGPHAGAHGRVVGFDDYHGENIVQFPDGYDAIVPDDALEKR